MKKILFVFLTVFYAAAAELPETCPLCGKSGTIRPIGYGDPGPEIMLKAEAGEILLGGCVPDEVCPSWRCLNCGREEEKPLIEFYWVSDANDQYVGRIAAGADPEEMKAPRGTKLVEMDGRPMLINAAPAMTVTMLESVQVYEHPEFKAEDFFGPRPADTAPRKMIKNFGMTLIPEDAAAFAGLTRAGVGRRLAIFVFGRPWMAPAIHCVIEEGKICISGSDTPDADRIAQTLAAYSERRRAYREKYMKSISAGVAAGSDKADDDSETSEKKEVK